MMEDRKEDKARLAAFQQHHGLGDEIARHRNPITADQVRKFRESPDIVLPPQMVRIERRQLAKAHSFLRTEKGGLAYIMHESPTAPYAVLYSGKTEMKLESVEGAEIEFKLIRMIGGEPLWIRRTKGGTKLSFLYRGNEVLAEDKAIDNVTLLRDGTIMYTAEGWQIARFVCDIGRDGKIRRFRDDERRNIRRVVQTIDEAIWFVLDIASSAIGGYANQWGASPRTGVGRHVVDLIQCFVKRFLVCEPTDEGVVVLRDFATPDEEYMRLGSLPYLSSCVQLADNRWAYIGKAPHDRQSWVVNGAPQPAFRWVSPIFDDPEYGLCYWGVYDNFLVTMKA